jgi:hypothetical protein
MFHLLRTNQSFDFRFMQWRTASRRQIHNDALRNQHWPGETPHYPTYVMYKKQSFVFETYSLERGAVVPSAPTIK